MARVNVENRLFADGRLLTLSREVGSLHKAIGALVVLWHDSQDEFKLGGTKAQIIEWLRPRGQKDGERFFEALLRCRFIKQVDDTTFHVSGNEIQLAALARHMAKSEKGGLATKKKWEKLNAAELNQNKKEVEGHSPAPGMPLPGSIQYNAVQDSAVSIQGIGKEYSEDFLSIWAAYKGKAKERAGSKKLAWQRFEKFLSSKGKSELFYKAAMKYLAQCERLTRFPKDMSTFIGTGTPKSPHHWEEFAEDDLDVPSAPATVDDTPAISPITRGALNEGEGK